MDIDTPQLAAADAERPTFVSLKPAAKMVTNARRRLRFLHSLHVGAGGACVGLTLWLSLPAGAVVGLGTGMVFYWLPAMRRKARLVWRLWLRYRAEREGLVP